MNSLIGQELGHYRIIEQLGEGGMAIVYKAFDTHLERDVAVKVIRTDQFAPAVLEKILKRFEREAKLLAKLSHPNIVGVIDYGEYENIPYLVMEYLPGGTLKERLGKPIPAGEAARILLPVARALDYAHRQGMIHRDVKPSNILITADGEPMLTDFGIAKLLEGGDSQTLTGTGVGIGTPEYMAPEQWIGEATQASDQYSLGVIFYEMVTGRKPFSADTPAAILLKQTNDPLPSPKTFVPKINKETENFIYKAMARNPKDRFPDMGTASKVLHSLTSVKFNFHPLESRESTEMADEKATVNEGFTDYSRNLVKKEEKSPTKHQIQLKSRISKPIMIIMVSLAVCAFIFTYYNLGIQGIAPLVFVSSETSTPSMTFTPRTSPTSTNTPIPIFTKTFTLNPTATFTSAPTLTPTLMKPATWSLEIYNSDCHEQMIYIDGNYVITVQPGGMETVEITYGIHNFHTCTRDGKCTEDFQNNIIVDSYWNYTIQRRPSCNK